HGRHDDDAGRHRGRARSRHRGDELLDADAGRMSGLPPAPPVLAERDVGEEPLRLQGDNAGRVSGQPFSNERYADLVADATLSLERGGDHDGYGLFVRQSSDDRYAAFVVSPLGAASILILD